MVVEGLFLGLGKEEKDGNFGALECGGALGLLLILSMRSARSVLMYPKPASKSRCLFLFFNSVFDI